jgi:hypothetical protein
MNCKSIYDTSETYPYNELSLYKILHFLKMEGARGAGIVERWYADQLDLSI